MRIKAGYVIQLPTASISIGSRQVVNAANQVDLLVEAWLPHSRCLFPSVPIRGETAIAAGKTDLLCKGLENKTFKKCPGVSQGQEDIKL